MILNICKKEACTGCGSCVAVCPKSAITMVEDEEGFFYPCIDKTKCINCGLCTRRCPSNNDLMTYPAKFYMGWNKDKKILLDSSSGGAFSAIAECIINKNGVVFGAVKDNATGYIYHKKVESLKELGAIRKSKYYQSKIGDVYQEAKQCLENHQWVLFSGTSCQIAGLYKYLENLEFDNLITVDILCHGVTSKKVVDAYLCSKEKELKKKIIDFNFRVKAGRMGWRNGTRMQLQFADGTEFTEQVAYDTFFLGFNSNFFLRPSCYQCKYCGASRISDFTIADFWGCDENKVTMDQLWRGVSLILFSSNSALLLKKEIENYMEIYPINPEEAILYNRALLKPQEKPIYRNEFFEVMEKKGYAKCIWKQFPYLKVKYEFKKILIKLLPRSVCKRIMKNI